MGKKNSVTVSLSAMTICTLIIFSGCNVNGTLQEDYPITPIPFTSVSITDDFWGPRIKRNHEVSIPIAFHQSEITGRIKNFEVAGGLKEGTFSSLYAFDDSDVYKIIEGASYSLQTIPDPDLEAYLDTLIYKIGMAQEEDGYLYTNRTIMGDSASRMAGPERWINVEKSSHELYNVGHMYEAAVAFYNASGKSSLLDIAIKNADLVHRTFGWNRLERTPGHQEIELALIKLYRATGKQEYLDLARFFLDARGPGGHKQLQMHLKVCDQKEAVGHAVRACYMYAAMADLAAIQNDTGYIRAIDRIWEDIVYRKTYVTGGIGTEAGNEGFDDPYVLPNREAYCETCASVGNVFVNHRLFLLHGESKYYDVLERTLYNSLLSGVSLSGDHFFYPNPLESAGEHERSEWFGCACCPSNISRFIPAFPGYIYATKDDELFINLFVQNSAEFQFRGSSIRVEQNTKYPWEGKVEISLFPSGTGKFKVKLRSPGWANGEAIPGDLYRFQGEAIPESRVSVNGKAHEYELEDGYILIHRRWKAGDIITYEMPMEIQSIVADARVKADLGLFAVQRGPLVFCAEWPESEDGRILDLRFDKESPFLTEFKPALLQGTQVIRMQAFYPPEDAGKAGDEALTREISLIPYHLWNNRGPGEMRVWLPQYEN